VRFPLVDLFAGCGGLSLGLERAGFTSVYVNELHNDALETYLANRTDFEVDLADPRRHSNDIRKITNKRQSVLDLANYLNAQHGELGLVVGGPPCQGFSGIGHRRTFSDLAKEDIPTNHLYEDMAIMVDELQPRAFIFENVRGLLSARWNASGEKGEIWADIVRTFSSVGERRGKKQYRIGWSLVYAKDYGVPQNRPRVVLVGIREDILFRSVSDVASGLIPNPIGGAPDLVDLLGDLIDPEWGEVSETIRYPHGVQNKVQEDLRRGRDGTVSRKGSFLTEMEYSKHSADVTAKFSYMLTNNGKIPKHFQTKKFAQRLMPARWAESGPSITATSLPDDYVHFSQPRILTVREWARLQTFPDWYKFSGKRTTGGRRRAGDPSVGDWTREVPKYTQIGNAVPVLLAKALGEHIREIID